jgi:hypothetical protein
MPQILIIHPYDRTTLFLNRIVKHLLSEFGTNVTFINIDPNPRSHELCLDSIRSHPDDGLLLFLGHGRSDKLFGARSDSHGKLLSNDAVAEDEDLDYFNENFIFLDNLSVFQRKKVICLACNSNDLIARQSIEFGARCFLGFGDIPTSEEEFKDKGVVVGDKTVAIMKGELNHIMKHSLAISIRNGYNFNEFKNIFCLVTNKRIASLLIESKGLKSRRTITNFLYYLKNEIKIHGDGSLNLINN